MAGRPKKLLGKVGALTERAGQLADDVHGACPDQYLERGGGGPIAEAWRGAVWASLQSQINMTRLQYALFEKAHGHVPPDGQPALDALQAKAAALPAERPPGWTGARADTPMDAEWERLRAGAEGRSSTASERKAWVDKWLAVPVEQIPADEAPGLEAVGLLQQAKAEPKWFYGLVYTKADGGSGSAEAGGGLTDEDRSLDQMLVDFEKHVMDAKANGEL